MRGTVAAAVLSVLVMLLVAGCRASDDGQNADAGAGMERLAAENERLAGENEDLAEKLSDLEAQQEGLQDRITSLTTGAAGLEAKRAELQKQADDLRDKLQGPKSPDTGTQQLKDKLKQADLKLRQADLKLKQAQDRLKQRGDTIAGLKKAAKEKQEAAEAVLLKDRKIMTDLAGKDIEAAKLKEQNSELAQKVKSLEKEVERLKATLPVREPE
ncbi:MAG: hypothetical protein QGD94_09880 [Planctomycetia bacterium]|nr:hypothetical protein [Planctomycetia bacterium]